jgi:hypothetical protein
MRPHNEIRYLAGGDEASEAIHVSKTAEDSLIVTHMLAEHGSVGEARADECRMDAPAHQVLTGGAHHAELRVLANDVAVGTRDGFF